MTSAQPILPIRRFLRGLCGRPTRLASGRLETCLLMGLVGSLTSLASCGVGHSLHQPKRLAAPYGHTALWAVAPLINESGTTATDTIRISDALTEELQQVQGINTVPVTRTLAVMHKLRMRAITTTEDAATLMHTLGVDGLIVGTVTAWDPYSPPTLGLALQLFIYDDRSSNPGMDSPPDQSTTPSRASPSAVAQAAGIFDAAEHSTLESIAVFATGRTHPSSAYGPDIYLVKMDLYTKFVAHQLLASLLSNEHERLTALTEY